MIYEIETESSKYYVKASDMVDAVSQVIKLCDVTEATISTLQYTKTFKELFTEVEAEEVVDRLEVERGESSTSESWYEHFTQMEGGIEDDGENL